MAAVEGVLGAHHDQSQLQQQALAPPPQKVAERLNKALQQQLNLDSVKTRAISLFKAISRILDEIDLLARSNAVPKWQDVLNQFSMVNLELFNIVEDIKKVSKAFVVHPKNVNAENATSMSLFLPPHCSGTYCLFLPPHCSGTYCNISFTKAFGRMVQFA